MMARSLSEAHNATMSGAASSVGGSVLGSLTPTVKLIQSIIPPKRARPIVGWVVSSGLMQKTVKVRVPRIVIVPKYRKYVTRHTMLLVHDANGECDVGDKVELAKSRPYSKLKHHIVSKILIKDPGTAFLRENPQYARTRLELKARRVQRQLEEDEYKVAERLKRQQARTKLAVDASGTGGEVPPSQYDPQAEEKK